MALSLGMFVTDTTGLISYMNPALVELAGHVIAWLFGKRLPSIAN